MEKFDDRLDGFSVQEYETLANAYNNSNGVLIENKDLIKEDINAQKKVFGQDDFVYNPCVDTIDNDNLNNSNIINKGNDLNGVIAPSPQISYVGLNDTERKYLIDLIQDLKQYYNNDYGLNKYLTEQMQEIERPLLYFVSKNKILSKIVNLLCCIFDKARLNKDMNDLVCELIALSKVVNSK